MAENDDLQDYLNEDVRAQSAIFTSDCNSAMTSVASTSSVASVKLTPEQILEATTLQQLQALSKSVDPSDDVLTTKKQVLIALINHVIKQADTLGPA